MRSISRYAGYLHALLKVWLCNLPSIGKRAPTHGAYALVARTFDFLGAIILGIACLCAPSFAQAPHSITISRASGLIYLTSYVMEQRHLVEKHAALLGLPDLTINWRNVTQAGGQTDEFLSGRVEIANGGIGALLLLWDRTGGRTKAIVATVNHSVSLVTRDPKIRSLRDYETADRIAVPTIGVSAHAMFLEMAAMQTFGKDQWARLNLNEVQMGQPTAFAAMTAPSHQVKSHAASPPFDALELAAIPEARIITTTADLPGNPRATLQFFTTTAFAEANPKIIAAIKAANIEAIDAIASDPLAAANDYREITKDKKPAEELVQLLKKPDAIEYTPSPRSTMRIAEHMFQTGKIKTMPASWKDFYLPSSGDLNGD